jgi:rhodanese-related sulfurtransferase
VLLRHGVDVDEICSLEAAYSPPYAAAMDIVNNAGNALDNILAERNVPVDAADFLHDFSKGGVWVLDIRGTKEAAPFREKYGECWQNIPQDQLRKRYSEIDTTKDYYLLCDTGPRSYEAQVFLASKGIDNTRNIQGGFAMIRATDPEFI